MCWSWIWRMGKCRDHLKTEDIVSIAKYAHQLSQSYKSPPRPENPRSGPCLWTEGMSGVFDWPVPHPASPADDPHPPPGPGVAAPPPHPLHLVPGPGRAVGQHQGAGAHWHLGLLIREQWFIWLQLEVIAIVHLLETVESVHVDPGGLVGGRQGQHQHHAALARVPPPQQLPLPLKRRTLENSMRCTLHRAAHSRNLPEIRILSVKNKTWETFSSYSKVAQS